MNIKDKKLIFKYQIPFYEIFQWEAIEGTTKYVIMEFFANMYVFNSIITRDWEVLGDVVKHIILPSVALSTIPLAIIARMTRSSMLDVLQEDYIRTAKAKGLGRSLVLFRHALKNASLPVVTIVGLQMGTLLAGAVLTETIFSWPGIGRWVYDGILGRDYPIVQGGTLVIAFVFIGVNFFVDIMYAFLDPRIRYN